MRIVLTGNTGFKIANFREGLIRALIARGVEVVVLAPIDDYHEKLISLGCLVHDLPLDRSGTSPINEAKILLHIYRFLKLQRPDFVFGYTIKNNIYAGLACRFLKIPFLPNVTGLGPAFNRTGILSSIVRSLYRVAFRRAHSVFFQNPDDMSTFVSAGLVSHQRAILLPGSGVDLSHFTFVPLSIKRKDVTFLLIARLLWDKGVGIYVDAVRELRQLYPSAKFQLIGPLDPGSRSCISELQLDQWVREGVVDYLGQAMDVRPALAEADCIVLPSWYREGTPRVLLEAASTGRPIITTDMPGCRDAVDDGITGIICPARDVKALAIAMSRFIEMAPSERNSMSIAARKKAEISFDEKIIIGSYLNKIGF